MGSNRISYPRSFTPESLPTLSTRGSLQRIRRFDGVQKSSRTWDSLRRDDELWLKDANCFVHLYEAATSRRGPSLRVPLRLLEQANSTFLLNECLYKSAALSPVSSDDDNSDSGYCGSINSITDRLSQPCELYIPAPAHLTRQEASLYHIGTRNYFAFLLSKPVVGESLGRALAQLAHRIEEWQPEAVNSTALLDYCQEQGYLDFSENVDYALASLYLAEQARINSIWVDAFAHCVGMQDRLDNCIDAEGLSETAKAMISKAALDMEVHISRMTRALGEFLEDDLGPDYLGLSKPLRAHLDRFRSYLHVYYVNQVGYFPPDPNDPWDKRMWCSMYDDFRYLYEFLADTSSSIDPTSNHGLNGGLCVVQNVQAFDERHSHTPLPHPLPLIPDMTARKRAGEGQRSLRGFKLGRSSEGASGTTSPEKQALAQASNSTNRELLSNRLVKEYIHFERQKLEEKVSISEARKVRWLLVYGVLQMLIGITRAPTEVQDTDSSSYPLCIATTGCSPPWAQQQTAVRKTLEEDRISIHPDCEAESADDYFAMNGISRSTSDISLSTSSPQLSRTTSIRSSVNSLHRSVVGSLSRRNSVRRGSLIFPKKEMSFCDTLVETQVNGSEGGEEERSPHQSPVTPTRHDEGQIFELEAPLPEMNRVPTLELHQLTLSNESHPFTNEQPLNSSASQLSALTSRYSNNNSNTSSYIEPPTTSSNPTTPSSELSSPERLHPPKPSTSTADLSTFDFGFNGAPSPSTTYTFKATSTPPPTYRAKHPPTFTPRHASRAKGLSVNAGTYSPSGATTSPPSRRISQLRALSTESVASESNWSEGSSVYPESSVQAAEIEEEEMRGRRRLRGLEGLEFGSVDGVVRE
ncbi:hypothetical protein M409DRAFT_66591 [Zasmidium cellare ATCC 36951]|uniref:DUF8004 domain-containing protein n=1 Tax=Zasmidium cellare ATCC 36951 TaxID=1080233 RepID=A0A6A6CLG9_ZASCE|nr:uncharacterized protein M409DRAFT_66591 [Zasmidium cellare ATCC 36951]KAF2166569.1 hypothetical protein M409DRAFT_66591 [Zasmidium cellare ATCC 36951]